MTHPITAATRTGTWHGRVFCRDCGAWLTPEMYRAAAALLTTRVTAQQRAQGRRAIFHNRPRPLQQGRKEAPLMDVDDSAPRTRHPDATCADCGAEHVEVGWALICRGCWNAEAYFLEPI